MGIGQVRKIVEKYHRIATYLYENRITEKRREYDKGYTFGFLTGIATIANEIGSKFPPELLICGAADCDNTFYDTPGGNVKGYCSRACKVRAIGVGNMLRNKSVPGKLIPLLLILLFLSGCLDLTDIAEPDLTGRVKFSRSPELWTAINTALKPNVLCVVAIPNPHYLEYSLEEVMEWVTRFNELIRELPPIPKYRECDRYSQAMQGLIVPILPGIAFGRIVYLDWCGGFQHSVNLFFDGIEVWLIDPVTLEVFQVDLDCLSAYSIIF